MKIQLPATTHYGEEDKNKEITKQGTIPKMHLLNCHIKNETLIKISWS